MTKGYPDYHAPAITGAVNRIAERVRFQFTTRLNLTYGAPQSFTIYSVPSGYQLILEGLVANGEECGLMNHQISLGADVYYSANFELSDKFMPMGVGLSLFEAGEEPTYTITDLHDDPINVDVVFWGYIVAV